MTFASFDFVALVATTFVPFYLLPQRARMWLLLAASYVFYAWWNPVYAILILASTVLDYVAARVLEASQSPRVRRAALLASVCGNIGLLGYFKYTGFALDSLRALLGPLGAGLPGPLEIVLPIGISFYTFQTLSYTIDVYRGVKRAERDFVLVALFVSFFPQLVAGPIERAGRLMPQLSTRFRFEWQNLEEGLGLVLLGFLKKLVIADRLALVAFPPYLDPDGYSTGVLVAAVLGMFAVVYLDFSAYSDIARGTALLFGIRLSENFRLPFAAANLADYWRRWHITMSRFVADYLTRPLLLHRRGRFGAELRAILLVMTLVGLWHGAQWTFVLWGFVNGVCLVGYLWLRRRVLSRPAVEAWRAHVLWGPASWTLTFVLRALASVLFFAPDLPRALAIYGRLLAPGSDGWQRPEVWLAIGVVAAVVAVQLLCERFDFGALIASRGPALRAAVYATGVQCLFFAGIGRSDPFIYYQF